METLWGRQIERSLDEAYDFIDAVYGKISLKGPLVGADSRMIPLPAAEQQLDNFALKVVRDAHSTVRATTVVVDLFGLTADQVARLKSKINTGLSPGHSTPIIYLD